MTVIDIFLKFAWAIPLPNKTADTITSAFKTIFEERIPEKIWVDQGSEFYNATFKALLK